MKDTLLVSKTTDIPQNALSLTDLHCINNVPHCKDNFKIKNDKRVTNAQDVRIYSVISLKLKAILKS